MPSAPEAEQNRPAGHRRLPRHPHRPALAGGHVPIDVTHVITGLVRAELGEGEADAGAGAVIGTGELGDCAGLDAKAGLAGS